MGIDEPMTFFTDLLLCLVVLVLGLRLLRGRGGRRSVLFVGIAFVATSVSALTGGLWHAFQGRLGPGLAEGLWMTTTVAVGAASFSLLVAATLFGFAGWPRRLLLILAVLKFTAFFVWMSSHDDFRFVVIDYLTSMAVVVLIMLARWSFAPRAAGFVVAGIGVSVLAALVQRSGFAPARWFNHNDLYHLIQIVAFVLLARGGRELTDRSSIGHRPERTVVS